MKNLICINKFEFTFIEKRLCFETTPEMAKIVAETVAAIEAEKERKKEQDKGEAESLRNEVNKIFESFPAKWQAMVHDLSGLEALKVKKSAVAEAYLIAHEAYRLGEIGNKKSNYSQAKENFKKSKEFYAKVSEYFKERLAKIKSLQDQIDQMWKRIPEIHKKSMRDSLLKYGDTADTLKQPYIKSEAAWKQAKGALSEENYENAIIEYQNVIEQYKIIAEIIGVNLESASPALGFTQHARPSEAAPAAIETSALKEISNKKEGAKAAHDKLPKAWQFWDFANDKTLDTSKWNEQKAKDIVGSINPGAARDVPFYTSLQAACDKLLSMSHAYDTWAKLEGKWKWNNRAEINGWETGPAKEAAEAGNKAWDKGEYEVANSEYQKLVNWQRYFKEHPDKTPRPLAAPSNALGATPGAAPAGTPAGKKSPETGPETDETKLEKSVLAILEKHQYDAMKTSDQLIAIKTDIENSVKKMNLKPGTGINFGAVRVKIGEANSIVATVEKPAESEAIKKENDEKLAAAQKLRNAAIRSLQSVTGDNVEAISSNAISIFDNFSEAQRELFKPGEKITTRKGIILQVAPDKKSVWVVSVDEAKLAKEERTLYSRLQSTKSPLLPKKPGEPSGSPETQVAKQEPPKKADAAADSSEGVRI